MVGEELDVSTIVLDAATGLALEVLLAAKGSEAPVLGDNDLLATRELVLGSAESLKSEVTVWLIWLVYTVVVLLRRLSCLRRIEGSGYTY